ncbi:MAG: hypothetical protein KGJ13_11820, partial [Patescibacteria group bacterium]|nr:hypothetical protein [Patescibacteria group bacterium]
MASLMLINPSRRPSKRRTHRKASPAQLRALAKARRARAGLHSNPAPRKRRHHAMRAAHHVAHRRARRNPIGSTGIMAQLTTAGIGAVGGLATNAVANLLPLPASLQMGWQKEATKMAIAIGLGMVCKKAL